MDPRIGVGCSLLMLLAALAVLSRNQLQARRITQRVHEAHARASGVLTPKIQLQPQFAGLVAALGSAVASSGLLPASTRCELEQTLRQGGFVGANSLGLFIGSKIMLTILLPLGAFMLLRGVALRPIVHFAAIAAAGVGGLMAPDLVIGRMRKSYLAEVERGLADGLDMMVICAEAGLALEAALRRVSTEVTHAHPKLAAELTITCNELSLISDARVALTNIGTRTGLSSFKRLGGTLLQAIQYGTPLTAALRTLAAELRQETLTRFEERAARLPVLLTIPMILFILPCVFLIVAGPIVIQVLKVRH